MKKISNIRKEKEGVSPVIATILMVAITVVLAAVLYVMVMGFTPPDTNVNAGAWNEAKPLSRTSGKAIFGQFSGIMNPINLRIYVKANGTTAGYITWGSDTDPSQVTWTNAPDGVSVTYFDYEPRSGEINSGDYIELIGLSSGTTYSLEVFNVGTSSIIVMTGDGSFTTPS